jgi:hypothetical protein
MAKTITTQSNSWQGRDVAKGSETTVYAFAVYLITFLLENYVFKAELEEWAKIGVSVFVGEMARRFFDKGKVIVTPEEGETLKTVKDKVSNAV